MKGAPGHFHRNEQSTVPDGFPSPVPSSISALFLSISDIIKLFLGLLFVTPLQKASAQNEVLFYNFNANPYSLQWLLVLSNSVTEISKKKKTAFQTGNRTFKRKLILLHLYNTNFIWQLIGGLSVKCPYWDNNVKIYLSGIPEKTEF